MTRRVVLCSLDPNMERPELREFRFNPFDRVLQNRGKYVGAALTVARAYMLAGCPERLPDLASFEDWSRTVRSALVWLGHADPCDTMAQARDNDPVVTELSAVLHSWHSAIGETWLNASAAKAVAEQRTPHDGYANADLHQALTEVAEKPGSGVDPKRLGKYLGRHSGRIIDGLKIQDRADDHTKQKVWRVTKAI